MKLFLYIILFKTIESKISIDISADCHNPTISYSGTGSQEATPRDMRNLFFIDDTTIKDYITAYFNTRPRKVLYSTSTGKVRRRRDSGTNEQTKNSIHKRFDWDPVSLVSTIKIARVKNTKEGPSIFLYRRFKNPTNDTKTINAGIEMPVAIALETSWFSDFEPNHDFVYDLNVIFNETSGTTGITHTTTLGKPSRVYEHVLIGQSNYEVDLAPGQNVVAKFSAKACNLVYKASVLTGVSGNLAVNFKEAVNGRHWWGPKIEDIFDYKNISVVSPKLETLFIRLNFYFDAKVDIIDLAKEVTDTDVV